MPQADGSIIIDTKVDEGGLSKGVAGLKKVVAGGALAIGAGVAVGVAAFAAFSVSSIGAAEEAATARNRIEQIATSMGVAGESAGAFTDRLVKLSETIAAQTGVDDASIQATQAKLLTFKALADTADEVGGAFDRATMAAVDMAAAGFGDAEGNAVQLGKALQDPIKGITALAKSGVTFTDAEKDMIKAMVEAGDMAGAQDMVLKAIETQVGGTAKATAKASDQIAWAWGEVQESAGSALLPLIQSLLPSIMDGLKGLQPVMEKTFGAIADVISMIAGGEDPLDAIAIALAETFGVDVTPFTNGMKAVGDAIGAAVGFFTSLWDNLGGLRELFRSTFEESAGPIMERFKQLWVDLQPILQVVGGAIAIVVGIVVGVLAGLAGAVEGIVQVISGVVGAVSGFIQGIYALFTGDWAGVEAANQKIKDSFGDIWGGLWATVSGFLTGFVDGVVSFFTGLYDTLVGHSIIPDMITEIVTWFAGLPGKAISAISSLAGRLATSARTALTLFKNAVVAGATLAINWMRDLPGKILTVMGSLGTKLVSAGKDLVAGLWQGIQNKTAWLKDRITGFVGDVTAFLKRLFGIASPSKLFEKEIGVNLALGIGSGFDKKLGTVMSGMSRSVGAEMGRFASLVVPGSAASSVVTNNEGSRTTIFQGKVRTYSEMLRAQTDIERGLVR